MLYVSQNKIQKYGGEMGMNQVMCDQDILEKFQNDIVKGTQMMKHNPPVKVNGSTALVQQFPWM
jgi:hypothetical protein